MSGRSGAAPVGAGIDRLLCLPHAGGTAAAVSGWLARAAPQLDVAGLEYPGHGRRMSEPFARSVADLVADLLPQARGGIRDIGLFGHSLGAVVAFELALALRTAGDANVVGVVVSGCSAPDSWMPGTGTELSDDVLLSIVAAGGGALALFEDAELRELLLPALRADMEIAGSYSVERGGKADFPVLALSGAEDPIAPPQAMEGWKGLTEEFAGIHVIPGGHFFPQTQCEEVGTAIGPLFSEPRRGGGVGV